MFSGKGTMNKGLQVVRCFEEGEELQESLRVMLSSKKSVLTGAFLVLALRFVAGCSQSIGPNPNAGSNPSKTPPPIAGTIQPLSMIRMFSPSNGWALSPKAVLFTTDGGKTWRVVKYTFTS